MGRFICVSIRYRDIRYPLAFLLVISVYFEDYSSVPHCCWNRSRVKHPERQVSVFRLVYSRRWKPGVVVTECVGPVISSLRSYAFQNAVILVEPPTDGIISNQFCPCAMTTSSDEPPPVRLFIGFLSKRQTIWTHTVRRSLYATMGARTFH